MTSARPVDVAVGVVLRSDGAVLLGQRPAGKPYAGWWEFPGGKLEAGESVHEALVRELDEELGLRVRASCPWVVRQFVYPHATVRLHFRRVFDFEGEPHGREGQAFAWKRPGTIDLAPLLPATVPVIGWLALPRACVRSAAAAIGIDAFVALLEQKLRTRAVGLLVLDEPAMPSSGFESLFHRVVPMLRAHGVRLAVGSRHPASFARAAGGVLLDAPALRSARARPDEPLVIALAHDASDLERAASLGADCVWVEPSPEGPVGAEALASAIAWTGVPAYASEAWALDPWAAIAAGAQGVVLPGSFWKESP